MESQRRRPPGAEEPALPATGGGRRPEHTEEPAQSADALTLEQVEAVLRRAVQLEQRKHVPDAAGLSREELTRIALEAGLSPEAVEEAMRELQVGALGAAHKPDLLDRVLGPASATSARVVPLPPDVARRALHRVLADALLEQVDRQGTRSIWLPESGARANLLRAVRSVWTGRKDLRKVEIACDVRPADATGERALVSLEARISGRGGYTAGPAIVAAATAIGTVLLASMGLGELAQHAAQASQVLVAAGGTAAIGTGIAAAAASASGRAWRQKVRRVRASLDRLLDQVAGDEA